MFVLQEVWYISKGTYTKRKALYAVYFLDPSNKSRNLVMVVDKEYESQKLHDIAVRGFELPSLEVTPKQFKYFVQRRDELRTDRTVAKN